jgi:long-chain acyl-CoA synthetase|tara:strand:- start:5385 stop:7091 length:1707 start_codon:yes stop_codon:yes gene_type:complete
MLKLKKSRTEAITAVCAPGQPYELQEVAVNGYLHRVFVNAPQTLPDLYRDNLSDLDFIIYEQQRLTFNEVYQQASGMAAAMVADFGIEKGDRVAISMRNYPEWIIAFYAATSIGAIAVAFNALWSSGDLANGVLDAAPKLIMVDQERLDRLALCEGLPASLQIVRTRALENDHIASLNWSDVLNAHKGSAMPTVQIDPDDHATILYTSGSTGFPKGVLSSHRAIINALLSWELDECLLTEMGIHTPLELDFQRGMLLAIPLFHVSGLFVSCLMCLRAQRKLGCLYKWDTESALALIERERLTVCSAPSAITGDIISAGRHSAYDLSSLCVIGGGGMHRAPKQVKAIGAFSDLLQPHTGWGMTETNGLGVGIFGNDYLIRPGSSGRCSAVLDIRVVDKEGNVLVSGEIGELQIRGTTLFRGYWNQPDAKMRAFDGEWFRTGDRAIIDEEGFVYINGRFKELIIRGGENIGCGAIEDAILEHPDVIEASAFGVPDDRLGEEIGVTLYVDKEIDESQLREFLSDKLAIFEIPRYVVQQYTPLIRGDTEKIQRRQVKLEAIKSLDLTTIQDD